MAKRMNFDFNGKKKAKKSLAKGLALGAAAGTAIGALAGVLFAPQSGKETREDIKDEVTTGAKKAVDSMKNAGQKISEEAKKLVKKQPIEVISSDDQIEEVAAEEAEEVK